MKSSNEEQLKALEDLKKYIHIRHPIYYRYYIGMCILKNASKSISEEAEKLIQATNTMVNIHMQEVYRTSDRIIMDGVPMRHKKDIIMMLTNFNDQLTEYMSILYEYAANNEKLVIEYTIEDFHKIEKKILQLLE